LLDGNGFALAEVGLHGLVFRDDGFGDPNTLYFTSRFNNEDDGLFGAMTTGFGQHDQSIRSRPYGQHKRNDQSQRRSWPR